MAEPVITCPSCQSFASAIDDLNADIEALQMDLHDATATEKPGILANIRDDRMKIGEQKRALHQCEVQNNCIAAPPPEVDAIFTGTVTLSIEGIQRLAPESISATVTFLQEIAWFIQITSFPTIMRTFDTPIGSNTTTITLSAGQQQGTYDPTTGAIPGPGGPSWNLSFHFAQSQMPLSQNEDSDITWELTTGTALSGPFSATGTPLAVDGNITLVGASQFHGGFLDSKHGQVVIQGTLSQQPPR